MNGSVRRRAAAGAHLPGMDSTTRTLTTDGILRTTAQAGSLHLTVWPDGPLGEHHRYGYRIEDAQSGRSVEGRELFTGVRAPVKPRGAIRDLARYLFAVGEARQYALDSTDVHAETEGLLPAWTVGAARRNSTALSVLTQFEAKPSVAEPVDQDKTAPRWVSVVFLQGAEADEVLDLLDRDGADTAIDYLAGYDFGEETTQAALENGYIYNAPPSGMLDRTAERTIGGDVYTLIYSPFLGHICLLRKYDTQPDPGHLGIGVPDPASEACSRRDARARRQEPLEWFSGPTRSAQHGRDLSL